MHSSQEEREPKTGELGCLPTSQLFLLDASFILAMLCRQLFLPSSAIGCEQVSPHYSN